MIGIEGNYLCEFRIADRKDFILEEELIGFKVIEEAGNVLPTFQLGFNSLDDSIMALLNEGNNIEISFGRNQSDMLDISLVPTRFDPIRSGENKRFLSMVGLYSALGYISGDAIQITDKKSGVEVIRDVTSNFFDTDGTFNINASMDNQNWIQPNITHRNFVNNCWIHSDVPGSFLACGITTDGKFILKDIKKDLASDYAWRFTSSPTKDNDIRYDADFGIDLNTGFINSWMGYKRNKLVYDLDAGSEEFVSEDVKPILALAKEVSRKAEIEERSAMAGVINENVHQNYWRSYLRNLSYLSLLGSVKLVLSFHNLFVPIRVLDRVMFADDIVGGINRSGSDYHSGLYYVTKVMRSVANRQFVTVVEICRESMNDTSGQFATAAVAGITPTGRTERQQLIDDLKTKFPGKFDDDGLIKE